MLRNLKWLKMKETKQGFGMIISGGELLRGNKILCNCHQMCYNHVVSSGRCSLSVQIQPSYSSLCMAISVEGGRCSNGRKSNDCCSGDCVVVP